MTTPSDAHDFDTIVIGAGVMGCASAYQLTRLTNRRVLLIEQYPLFHDKGSSHGGSRIIRYVQDYGVASDHYMRLIIDAYKEWSRLEELSGQKLILRNGLLWVGTKAQADIWGSAMKRFGCEYEILNSGELARRFPHLQLAANNRKDGRELWALWDPNGGTVLADKALAAMLEQIKKNGGSVKDEERVRSIDQLPQSGGVIVRSNKGLYKACNIILTSGGWSKYLMPEFPVRYESLLVASQFWQVKPGHEAEFQPSDKPGSKHSPNMAIAADGGSGQSLNHFYMIPCVDYPDKVKFSIHTGIPIGDMSTREQITSAPEWLAQACAEQIRKCLPGLDASRGPAVEKTCIYTMAADESIRFGRHPRYGNVLFAGPFSGTGFKFAPAIGRVMAELAAKGHFTDFDVAAFGAEGGGTNDVNESKL